MSSYGYETKERPSVVTAASVVLYVFAAGGVIGAVIAFAAAHDYDYSPLVASLTLRATWMLVVGLVEIVLATKILRGSNGARITAIVMMTIAIVLDVIRFHPGSFVSISLAFLVIGLLAWNKDAKAYFREL